jgi:hypothetical protein
MGSGSEKIVSRRGTLLAALAALYVAQGVPFGFATEYLPVVLRKAHYSMTSMGAGCCQAPVAAEVLWASAADRPWARKHTSILLVAQILRRRDFCFAIASLEAPCFGLFSP